MIELIKFPSLNTFCIVHPGFLVFKIKLQVLILYVYVFFISQLARSRLHLGLQIALSTRPWRRASRWRSQHARQACHHPWWAGRETARCWTKIPDIWYIQSPAAPRWPSQPPRHRTMHGSSVQPSVWPVQHPAGQDLLYNVRLFLLFSAIQYSTVV